MSLCCCLVYRVWPELDPSPDGSTDVLQADLVPPSLCLPGVGPMMRLLAASTQKPEPKARARPPGGGRGGLSPGRGLGRGQGGSGRGGRLAAGAAASTVAAAAVGHSAFDGGGVGADGSSFGADSCGRQYQQQYDHEQGFDTTDDEDGSPAGFNDSTDAGKGVVAAGGAPAHRHDAEADEDAWYAAAAAAGWTFSWRDALRGRFYKVEYRGRKGPSIGYAVLTPKKVVTRRTFQDELW